ncbi:MAG TPA: hypothetical protein VMX79_09595 [bacterium]|nr:hypothetical protein [bacterium]
MAGNGEENGGLNDDDGTGKFVKESDKGKATRPTPSKPEKSDDK